MECDTSYKSNHDSSSQSEPHQTESVIVASHARFQSGLSLGSPFSNNYNYNCLATLKNHTSYISSLALAGKFLYTGSSDREIRSWKRIPLHSEFDNENSIASTVTSGNGAVKSLVIHADKLFSAHQDHKIRVWKVSNYEPDHQKYTRVATLPTLGDRAFKMLIPKNHVKIRRHKTCTWVHHVDAVSALALSKDENLLYSVSWDRTIKIWSTLDFTCVESVNNAHDDAINTVAISEDGHLYTGSADKKIKVWRKAQGQKKHSLVDTLEKHKSGINALALSDGGYVLYSGAGDRSILVWEKDDDNNRMIAVSSLRGHTKSILCLFVVSDLLCSGSADKTIRIWRGVDNSYSCLMVLEGHGGPIKSLTATIDRCNNQSNAALLVYSGCLDCEMKVWKISIPVA